MLHELFNPGPLTLIVALDGRLMDPESRIEADPADKTIARLLRRNALIDLGPVITEPEPEE